MTNTFTICPCTGTIHIILPRAAPGYAGSTRPLAVYDPAAAQQRADAARLSADAGALVPSLVGVAGEPIKAVPLAASAPKVRAEPPGIRAPNGLLPYLRLRVDLPVHFIDEKTVTATDVDPQQNRFRLPIDGVIRNLRPVLSVGAESLSSSLSTCTNTQAIFGDLLPHTAKAFSY